MTTRKKILLGCLFLCTLGLVSAQETDAPPRGSTNEPFRLHLPVSGSELVDWHMEQYFDHDPASGVRDYRGGGMVVNAHRGIDFSIPSFRWMDDENLQIQVLAVADGVVTDTHDGEPDRNTSCRGQANYVIIRHPNGFQSRYLHLKKGSVVVSVGQEVVARQELGIVGSSGCSFGAHLHFELKNQSGQLIDPFLEDLWIETPAYNPPLTIMDYNIFDADIGEASVKDPPANITSIAPGPGTFGIGLSLSVNTHEGQKITFVLENGNTRLRHTADVKPTFVNRMFWLNWPVDKSSGTWIITAYVNEQRDPAFRHEVRVSRERDSESRAPEPETPSVAERGDDDWIELRRYRPTVLRHHSSASSSLETAILFVNDTGADISIHWVDLKGTLVSRGVIVPGAAATHNTFQGHLWAINDADGEVVAVFRAERQPGRAVVRGATE